MAALRRSSRKREPVNYGGQEGDIQKEDSDASVQGEETEGEISHASVQDEDSEEVTKDDDSAESTSEEDTRPSKKRKTDIGAAKTTSTGAKPSPRAQYTRKQPSARPPSMKKKAGGLQNMQLAELEDIDNLIGQDTSLVTSTQTPMEIESDIRMRHLNMFNNVVDHLKVTKAQIKPTRDDTLSVETLLAGPVHDDRQWTFHTVSVKKDDWRCKMTDHSKPIKATTSFNCQILIPKIDVPEKSQAERIGKRYCELMERLPFPLPSGKTSNLKVVLKDVVIRSVLPQSTFRLHSYFVETEENAKANEFADVYSTYYKGVNPLTGESFSTKFKIRTKNVNLKVTIPPLPDHVAAPEYKPNSNAHTTEDKARARYAYDLTVYIAYKLHHSFGTREALKVKQSLLLSKFLLNMKKFHIGPYGGARLYGHTPYIDKRIIRIYPSKPVRDSLKNVEGGHEGLPSITIRGLSLGRAQQVIQVMVQTWMRTGDILKTWKAACTTADLLNIAASNGDDFIGSTCMCTPEQSQTECHVCDLCGNVELCQALELNASGTALTCSNCRTRNPNLLRKQLSSIIKREYQALGLESDSADEISRAISEIEQSWNEEKRTWKSDYTGEGLSENLRGTGRQRDPFAPGIDGRFQVFYSGNEDEALRYHTPGNLSICEAFINYLKYVYPPGILNAVLKWISSKQDEASRGQLLEDMNNINVVRAKTPRNLLRRLTKQVDNDSWEATKQEFLTCKPLPTPLTNRVRQNIKKYHSKKLDAKRATWRLFEYERVLQVISEIEQAYATTGKVLRRSEDGCPFPFDGAEMPSDWSWWSAFALFSERIERMWLLCNGYWITIDTIETIYLECIVQFFDPLDADPLRLLVFSIFYGHPLRFVVAARYHRRPMRSTFTTQRPTSIADRDPALGNMSIEPHISNMMKLNFAEDTYEPMVARLKKIKLSKECFDPTYKSKATNATAGDLYTEEDLEADFDDDVADGTKLFEFGDEALEEGEEDQEESGKEDDDSAAVEDHEDDEEEDDA